MGTRPNILLITTDQQRGDCLGCAGHPAVETPYLDQLAMQGARFNRAYSAVPSCIPTRAALMTGMDQWNHGRLEMTGNDPLDWPTTLPAEFARAGYHTQAVGKMHFIPQRRLYGFHNMVLDESGRRQAPHFISDYHAWFEKNKQGAYNYNDYAIDWNSWMARPSHLPEHLHPSHWTAQEGINFLQRRDPTSPFFMWLSFARPHSPYDAPQSYWDMYVDNPNIPKAAIGDWAGEFDRRVDDVNAPRTRRTDREIHRARAGYYGNITFIDHQIGRLLTEYQRLDPQGFKNTFILFTSDHGDMMGDHHHWRKTYGYEGSARVPFLIKYPDNWEVPRGQVLEQPIELRDVMPTLLDAAGLPIPASCDGQSVLQITRDEGPWREYVYGEHTTCYTAEYGMQYITDGREKFIWFHHTGREQFFHLADDPDECRELSKDPHWQERIALWRRRLAEINELRGDPRGSDGKLVVQERAISLTPKYHEWKQRFEESKDGGWSG